jgi:hypothetical protein
MKRQLLVCFGLAVCVAWAIPGVRAQGASQDAQKGKATTVTGCLEKGADANSFVLREMASDEAAKGAAAGAAGSAAAKSYHVTTSDASLKLAGHVGHRVSLTGTVEEMAGKSAAGAQPGTAGTTGTAGAKAASPHLTVTSMKHIAPTCTQ